MGPSSSCATRVCGFSIASLYLSRARRFREFPYFEQPRMHTGINGTKHTRITPANKWVIVAAIGRSVMCGRTHSVRRFNMQLYKVMRVHACIWICMTTGTHASPKRPRQHTSAMIFTFPNSVSDWNVCGNPRARILCTQRRFSDFMCNTPAGRRRCGASICKNAPPEIVNNNLIVHSFKIIYIYVQCTAALCCTTSIASAYSKVYILATSTHAPELFTSLIALMCALVCPGLSGLRCFAACSSFRVWHALQPHTSEHACSVCV